MILLKQIIRTLIQVYGIRIGIIAIPLLIPVILWGVVRPGTQLNSRDGFSILITETRDSESGLALLNIPFLGEAFPVAYQRLKLTNGSIESVVLESVDVSLIAPDSPEALELLANKGTKPGYLPRLLNGHPALSGTRLDNHHLFLSGVQMKAGVTFATLSMVLQSPEDDIFTFHDYRVRISTSGIEWCGVNLFLNDEAGVNNMELPFTIKKGSKIEFNCDGFQSFRFDCEYRFDRKQFKKPVSSNIAAGDTVLGNFTFVSDTLWQFIGTIRIDEFEAIQLPGFSFGIDSAVIDLDTRKNADGLNTLINSDIDLKDAYKTLDNTWQGFFMKRMVLKLPVGLGKSGNQESFSLSINNFIADGKGFSGLLSSAPNLPAASIEGWGISLDTLDFKVVLSSFKYSNISGKVNIPIMEGNLKYKAAFIYKNSQLEMGLTLGMDGVYKLPILNNAQCSLFNNSNAKISYKNKKFIPRATLNGRINLQIPSPKLDFPLFEFQEFRVNDSTLATQVNSSLVTGGLDKISIAYFKIGGAQFNNPGNSVTKITTANAKNVNINPASSSSSSNTNPSVSNFPLFIKELKFGTRSKNNQTQYGLSFISGINLMENKLVAAGLFSIWGSLDYTKLIPGATPYQPWKAFSFAGFDWDGLYINGDLGPVALTGGLKFIAQDPVWGEGFKAAVEMKIKEGLGISVTCYAQFGTAPTSENQKFRYFFVDASLVTQNGIPAGPISIHGLSGGFFYNMKEENAVISAQARAEKINVQSASSSQDPNAMWTFINSITPGTTASGAKYIPAKGSTSFNAGIIFALLNAPHVLTAEAVFGMAFNPSGGINSVSLGGKGYMMSENLIKRKSSSIKVCINLKFNNQNPKEKELVGNLGALVNFAGFVNGEFNGNCKIQNIFFDLSGTNAGNFYFYFGLPQPIDQRASLSFNILGNQLFGVKAYFAVVKGNFPNLNTNIPSPNISLGGEFSNLNFNGWSPKSISQVGNSNTSFGVSFGSRLQVGPINQNFLFMNGSFTAVLGADVQFGYNPNLSCGQNGWFFQGSVYAGVKASMNIFGYNIGNIIAGAALSAKMPNPFYAEGVLTGQYSIANNTFTGCFYFPFKLGSDNCGTNNLAQVQSSEPRIKYGDIIRIQHVATKKSLRAFKSKDEVVAHTFYNDNNFDWLVEPCGWCGCKDGFVVNGEKIRLLNTWTGRYLEATGWGANLTKNQKKAQHNGSTLFTNIEWIIYQDGGGIWTKNKHFNLVTPGNEKLHSHNKTYPNESKWGNLRNQQEVTVWTKNDDNDWWVVDFKK